jgi:hypothetical protein
VPSCRLQKEAVELGRRLKQRQSYLHEAVKSAPKDASRAFLPVPFAGTTPLQLILDTELLADIKAFNAKRGAQRRSPARVCFSAADHREQAW